METIEFKSFQRLNEEIPIRMSNITKYAPIFDIMRLNVASDKYKEFELGSLTFGVISLLLYEGHLKSRGLEFEEILSFVDQCIKEHYEKELTEQELSDFTRYLLNKIQNNGIPFEFTYYDNVKREYVTKKVRYITYTRDAQLKKNLYKLTSDGIDFLLQTKEFNEESKITIHLLLLRKMVDNEDFDSALQTLININAEIRKEFGKKEEILEELALGITDRYEKYTAQAEKRFKEEAVLFDETMENLRTLENEYIQKIDKEQITEKEIKFKAFVTDMKLQLGDTVQLHSLLLDAVIDLRHKAENILTNRRKNIFNSNLNFMHLLEKFISMNSAHQLKSFLDPLLRLNIKKSFSIDKIDDFLLHGQKLSKEDADIMKSKDDDEVVNKITIDEEIERRIVSNYTFFMREFIEVLMEKSKISLEEYLEHLITAYGESICSNSDLIPFIVKLSRNSDTNDATKCLNFKEFSTKSWKPTQIEGIYLRLINTESSYFQLKNVRIQTLNDTTKRILHFNDMSITNFYYEIIGE